MKLKTRLDGDIEYEEDDIITFPNGIPGLDELRKFIIKPFEENDVFSILYSLENTDIGIVVTSPFNIIKNYEFELNDKDIEFLKVKDSRDIVVFNTVTLNSKVENITVNLKAPIIINIKEKLGEQIILDKQEYKIKHPLISRVDS
jgi:flagellar assembly factor FliW